MREQRTSPGRNTQLAVAFATNMVLEVTYVTGSVAGPTFERVFALSRTQLGIALGAVHVGLIFTAPLIGRITHRRGSVPVLTGGLLGVMLACAIIISAGGFGMLFGGLALLGVAAAMNANANSTLVANLAGTRVRRAMALASALWFASSAFSSPAIGAWLGFARSADLGLWGHRAVYVVDAVLILTCLAFVRFFLARTHKRSRGRPDRGRSDGRRSERAEAQTEYPAAVSAAVEPGVPARTGSDPSCAERMGPGPGTHGAGSGGRSAPAWLWLPILGLFHGLLAMTLLSWTNPMLQAKFGVGEFQGALGVGLMSLGIGVGRLVLAALPNRFDDRVLLAGSGSVGGVVLLLALLSPSYVLTMIAITAGGLTCSFTLPCILSLVGERFAASKSRVYGYTHASISAAGLAGPALIGLLSDSGVSIHNAMMISPFAGWAMAAVAGLWLMRDRRHTAGRGSAT